MGWFDKKSWQLRRKIRDLQSELAAAERDGKYVVEQGLFFAELQEMGDATLMVLGTADHLDSEEDTVIRNFFERNGFTVENLRLDKTQKTLAAVEIIPPQELTKRVAKALKDQGYRLIDDSDQERPSDVAEKKLTLSGLIRSISALFATHVHKLIINTPIKMNMEGNRLLHWMPLVREALVGKASPDVVGLCREPFVDAYNHYYGQLGRMENPEALEDFAEESVVSGLDMEPILDAPPADQWEKPNDAHKQTPPVADRSDSHDRLNGNLHRGETDAERLESPAMPAAVGARTNRETDTAYALATIYKSLIGASDQRRVRNAEVVLDTIARFFGSKSACLLIRRSDDTAFTVQSNSPGQTCIETNNDGVVCTDSELLLNASNKTGITVIPPANGSREPQAVIAPLSLDGARALIYLAAPGEFSGDADGPDSSHFAALAKVFREFPDLLLAEKSQKNETTVE